MSQKELLIMVTGNIDRNMPEEYKAKLVEAGKRINAIVDEYGEVGRMALALCGLTEAAKAEEQGIPPIEERSSP